MATAGKASGRTSSRLPDESRAMPCTRTSSLPCRSRGQFRAMMDVPLVNEGPVTLLIDSRKNF
jgi:D-Tyr-tRNAtyr deacylase